jgi:hypothetical protein
MIFKWIRNMGAKRRRPKLIMRKKPWISTWIHTMCWNNDCILTQLKVKRWRAVLKKNWNIWKRFWENIEKYKQTWTYGEKRISNQTRQTMHIWRNNEVLSSNHCCGEKVMCYILWVFVSSLSYSACKVHAPHFIVVCDLFGSTNYFHIIP